MVLEEVNGLCQGDWHFVQQAVFCHQRIICAKVQQQLLLLTQAAYGTCGALGTMETKLQQRVLNLCVPLDPSLVNENSCWIKLKGFELWKCVFVLLITWKTNLQNFVRSSWLAVIKGALFSFPRGILANASQRVSWRTQGRSAFSLSR